MGDAVLVVGVPSTRHRWRREFHAHVRDHAEGVELVVLQDSTEALTTDLDAVVVDDVLDFLTPTQVLALRDRGVRVLGLYDGSGRQGRGRHWLVGLGVDPEATLEVGERPSVLLDALATLDPRSRRPRRINGAKPAGTVVGPPVNRHGDSGMVVVVGGGSDSPGRTEIAVATAGALATGGESVVLLDLDEHHPSLAARLGYQIAPNVLDASGAIRAAADLGPCLARRAGFAPADVGFDAICGLANPGEWAQLREVPSVLDALAARWRYVVVDTGATCAPDQVPPGGARNAATRAALRSADEVVAVCGPTPLGVLRFLRWAADAAELLGGDVTSTVAVNRAPRGRFHRGELAGQIAANVPDRLVDDIVFIERDDAVEAAVWDAVPVGRGRFSEGVGSLVERFAPAGKQSRSWLTALGGRR
jgi:MinD-like ATPase involved in chromosome partitioning or flagellar assembly